MTSTATFDIAPQTQEYSVDYDQMSRDQQITPPLLLQYWQVVLRRKWIILFVVLSTLVAALIMTLLTTPRYTATARIEISREQKNITKVDGVDSVNAGRDLEFYSTQYELVKARSVAERVAHELHLSTNSSFFKGKPRDADKNPLFQKSGHLLTTNAIDKREALIVDTLLSQVTIAPIRGSSLIDIKYTSTDPQLAATIANTWTQQFIQESMDRRFASTADARKFLEARHCDDYSVRARAD